MTTPLNLPNFIYCSITGKRFAVRRDVLLDRIKQAGGYERLKKTYVSREARALLKTGKTIEEVRQLLGVEKETANMNLTDTAAKTSSSMAKARIHQGDDFHAFWRDPGWVTPRPGVPLGTVMTPSEIREATKDSCLNPPMKLDKQCHKCYIFENCTLPSKIIPRK